MSSKYSTPSKSGTFYLSNSSTPKKLSDSELKSLELQALSLIDTDISQSKAIIENCLRLYDELTIPVLENIYLHYLHCDICIRVNQTELAISSGEKALSLIDTIGESEAINYQARTLQLLGILYTSTNSHRKSVHLFQRLLKILETYEIPSISQTFVIEKIIDGLLKSQKLNLARPYLEKMLSIERDFFWLLKYGKLLFGLGDNEMAIKILSEANNLAQKNTEERFSVLSSLACVYVKIQEYRKAIEVLNECVRIVECLELAPSVEVLWVYSQLGQLYYTEDDLGNALGVLQTSKVLSEDLQIFDLEYGNILLYIGKIKARRNEKNEALGFFNAAKKALENSGKENALDANLAILELYLKDENVMRTWEVLQELEKSNYSPVVSALAENELGNLLRKFGHLSQALKYYQSALEKYEVIRGQESQETGKVLFNIGTLLFQMGRYNEALESLNKSQSIKSKHFAPNSAELGTVMLEIGKCLIKLGKKGCGREKLEKGHKILKGFSKLTK